ncbi:MAG: PD-(D/E)XK nuclease family protein [Clostridia bacterium]
MPAKLTFVLGRAGSGKSRYLHTRIAELDARGETVAVIVPEQFTFETERELAAELPGLMNISVYSFTTLARKVLGECGDRTVFLSKQGRRMMIRKAAGEAEPKLMAFAQVCTRPGFAEKCDEMFSLFKRFEIDPPSLVMAAEKLEDGPLRRKLTDLSLLYSATCAQLEGHYMDSEDAFSALKLRLPSSSLCGKHIVIDGFDLLTEQIYSVIGSLMQLADTLMISVRMDDGVRDAAVFAAERKAYTRLRALAQDAGCAVSSVRLPDSNATVARYVNPALSHIEHEAFAYPFSVYAGEPHGIELFAGTDRMAEAEALTNAVVRAAKRGIRYRDMAVVAADMAAYLSPVSRALCAHGIPFFTDAKHKLSIFAAPRLAVFALRAASRGFAQSDIISLLRTGLCGADRGDAEIFENYLLQYGLHGNALTRPFDRGQVPPRAEAARSLIMPPLIRLKEALGAGDTINKKTEALYAYMQEVDIRTQLYSLTCALRTAGKLELMEENAQVYNKLMELLSQLHAIIGDARVSSARYIEIFTEGLDAYDVGAIPTTADQVLFGSVGRTRARSVKAMFIIGAAEGLFPHFYPDDDVIDDAELSKLHEIGLTPWDSSADKCSVELVNTYSALTKPSEYLYISYPLRTDGEACLPAAVVDRIRALFPTLSVQTDLAAHTAPVDAEGGFTELISSLREFCETGKPDAQLAPLYSYYAHDPRYKERLALVESALYDSASPEPFGMELALELYRNIGYGSASRLELYNACPFKHFVRYGLRALPRREFTERKPDEGSFCHEALAAFVEKAREMDMAALDNEQVCAILDKILPKLIESHNNGIFLDTARNRARCALLIRRIKTTAWALTQQLASGGFRVAGTEVEFGDGKPLPALHIIEGNREYRLSGRIDRLDTANIDGESYYRVVDYKSGERTFDYAQLYHGLSLQLPLYIAAAGAADSAAHAAGMYYLPIKDPAINEDTPEEKLSAELYKQFRLRGLTLNDPRVVAATRGDDAELAAITARSGMVSTDQLDAVVDYAASRARTTLQCVMEGHAETAPIYDKRTKTTACKYCDYASVCRFDPQLPGCTYNVTAPMNADAFFSATKKEEQS